MEKSFENIHRLYQFETRIKTFQHALMENDRTFEHESVVNASLPKPQSMVYFESHLPKIENYSK